jgi:RsiW-degrading membrane proteinase PrsW (M82 family)
LAALAALFHTGPGMLLASNLFIVAIVFGPTVEEVMKIGVASLVVETRPYLFKRVEQLQVATVGTALLFAAIENVVYLYVYHPNHSVEYAVWRWTVCVALHVGCTLVATRGLAAVWRQAVREYRPPKLAQGVRWLVVAIVIHGSYNAAALMHEFLK